MLATFIWPIFCEINWKRRHIRGVWWQELQELFLTPRAAISHQSHRSDTGLSPCSSGPPAYQKVSSLQISLAEQLKCLSLVLAAEKIALTTLGMGGGGGGGVVVIVVGYALRGLGRGGIARSGPSVPPLLRSASSFSPSSCHPIDEGDHSFICIVANTNLRDRPETPHHRPEGLGKVKCAVLQKHVFTSTARLEMMFCPAKQLTNVQPGRDSTVATSSTDEWQILGSHLKSRARFVTTHYAITPNTILSLTSNN